jgi:hypothetical protein
MDSMNVFFGIIIGLQILHSLAIHSLCLTIKDLLREMAEIAENELNKPKGRK